MCGSFAFSCASNRYWRIFRPQTDRRISACRKSGCGIRRTICSGSSGDVLSFDFHQRLGGAQHGLIGRRPRLLDLAAFPGHLRLEEFPFGGGKIEIDRRTRLLRRIRRCPCPDKLYSRGSPQSLKNERSDGSAGGRARSSSIFFSSTLPMRLMKSLKLSPFLRSGRIAVRQAGHHFRNILRRDRDHRQAVGPPLCSHSPPRTTWKCGTAYPAILRLTP